MKSDQIKLNQSKSNQFFSGAGGESREWSRLRQGFRRRFQGETMADKSADRGLKFKDGKMLRVFATLRLCAPAFKRDCAAPLELGGFMGDVVL
jgi:hypothetical protein